MDEKKVSESQGKKEGAPGQQKLHRYQRVNPDTGAQEFSEFPQSEHHTAKAQGWVRIEEAEGTTEAGTTGSGEGS